MSDKKNIWNDSELWYNHDNIINNGKKNLGQNLDVLTNVSSTNTKDKTNDKIQYTKGQLAEILDLKRTDIFNNFTVMYENVESAKKIRYI